MGAQVAAVRGAVAPAASGAPKPTRRPAAVQDLAPAPRNTLVCPPDAPGAERPSTPSPSGETRGFPTLLPEGPIDLCSHRTNAEERAQAKQCFGFKAENLLIQVACAKRSSPQVANIPDEDLLALHQYTVNDFKEINSILRSNDPIATRYAAPKIKAIASALNQLPSYQGTVYRSAQLDALTQAGYKPGEVVGEKAFMSTSTEQKPRENATKNNTYFVIESKRNGHDLSAISAFRKEHEVLFTPGTRFRVLANEPGPQPGTTLVRLEEVV